MNIAVPDCSLFTDGLDRMSGGLLERHPTLLFRMHAVRMQLQLDALPSMSSVEQWARALQAKFDQKKQRVAAVQAKAKDPGPPPKADPKRPEGPVRELCRLWSTEDGCKRGRNYQYAHTPEKPGRRWICGANHQKAECTAPGGGKGPAPRKPKAGAVEPKASPKDGGGKGSGKPSVAKAQKTPPAQEAAAAIKKATMRESVAALSQIKHNSELGIQKGLIDGGATCCLRTAREQEKMIPPREGFPCCGYKLRMSRNRC